MACLLFGAKPSPERSDDRWAKFDTKNKFIWRYNKHKTSFKKMHLKRRKGSVILLMRQSIRIDINSLHGKLILAINYGGIYGYVSYAFENNFLWSTSMKHRSYAKISNQCQTGGLIYMAGLFQGPCSEPLWRHHIWRVMLTLMFFMWVHQAVKQTVEWPMI